ncbi:MAG: hypothetical protein IKU43_01615 [Clostridia bacterium]|nr:hypothetical protein [Clostridia bacterium]
MKKILSAVFVMAMLIIAATITGSVLAAEPYQYTPDDGKPVVYVSAEGNVNASIAATSNGKEYKNLKEAVAALGGKDGYVILLEEFDVGRSYQFPGNKNGMVILRGRDDLDTFVPLRARYMCSLAGNYTFENLELQWYKVDDKDNDQSLQCGTYQAVFGKDGDPNSILVTGMETLTGANITINGGTFSIRMATWGSTLTTNSVNIVLNGGTIKNISGAHSGPTNTVYGTDCKGDFNITINGGTFNPSGINFGQPGNNMFKVGGDYTFTVNGGTLAAGTIAPYISGKKPSQYSIGGNTIVNILNYNGDKAALASKFKATDWNLLLTNTIYVSDAGDDSNAGTEDAPLATYAKAVSKLGAAGGVITVKGTLTLDNITEATRSAAIVFNGGKVVINGDYAMGGPTIFMGTNIVNGANGAIVANGNALSIMATVKTTAGADGKYIDVVAGKRDGFTTVNVVIKAGTYNIIDPTAYADGSKIEISSDVKTIESGVREDVVVNALTLSKGTPANATIELIDFVNNTQAVKVSPAADVVAIDYSIGKVNPTYYKFATVKYYVNIKDTDTVNAKPVLVIGENAFEAEQAMVNGWNIATFELAGLTETFQDVTFYPYADAVVASHNKFYAMELSFSQLKNITVEDLGELTLTKGGDYIPVLDDFVMEASELVNTSNIIGATVAETPFVAGPAVKVTPEEADGVTLDYYVLNDGAITSLRGDFQPYVRVEYYMYARETDVITDTYPSIVIGGKTYVASEKLVANKWAVATFNIGDIDVPFQSFTYNLYGAAEGLNTWNKMYIQKIAFSQTENKAVTEYPIPEMTEDGIVVPYEFNPAAEGLEVLPVVYYADGGIYDGAADGSINSLYAYGTLAKAAAALDKVGGGYVILTSDIVINAAGTNSNKYDFPAGSVPSHSKMLILRGMQKKEGEEKIKLYIGGMPQTRGPLWVQNLDMISVSSGDTGFKAEGHEFCYGTPGGDYNDVTTKTYGSSAALPYMVIGGGDGGTFNSVTIKIYSGKHSGSIRTTGAWGGTTVNGDVNIEIHGGDLSGATWQNGHANNAVSKVMGNYNVTITGGKLPKTMSLVNNGTSNPSYVGGNINVKISGNPDISAMDNGGIKASAFAAGVIYKSGATADLGCAGKRIIDTLEYEGNGDAIRAKINETDFDILNISSIYLKDGGNGDGSTEAKAFGTLPEAIAACVQEKDGKIYGGKVVICGNGFTVDGTLEEETAHTNTILYTSVNGAALKFQSGSLELAGPVNFKNLKLENTNSDESFICANGNAVTFDTGITGVAADGKYITIVGGCMDEAVDAVNVTVNSGKYENVIAGADVTGNVSIVFNGGTVEGNVIGGSSVEGGEIGGNTSIVINGGEFKGYIVGGNDATDAVINGVSYIEINGGEFTADTTILALNTVATATVAGNAEIKINGGDFSDMTAGQIQKGNGECGDKVCVDYKAFEGSVDQVTRVLANNFDVVVVKPQDKPVYTAADKFVFIIAHYGDPTAALKKSIPFKVTQTAAQTGAPIVVSPKQLNLKMDGSDHALMSIQTVKDTVETIRFIPNHNPTKGNSIVVDGYNINGRGVDVPSYKYIEIVYYYSVPEGATPAVKNMSIRYIGNHTAVGTIDSAPLVANKWATTIIDVSEKVAGQTGALKQYHFNPMGSGKKGADIPADQYIDIASLTFYTDKPNTVIQGGNAPNAKIEAQEEEKKAQQEANKKPAKIEDIVVSIGKLKNTVDNSGAFTSAQVTKDGMTVMEYTPAIDVAKDLRIEGYDCMGKLISLNEYQYLTMKVLVETERTDVTFKPQVVNCNGGVQDNPEKAASVTWTSETALVPNQWTTVTIKIAPADPAKHVTRQFHVAPIGNIKANTMKDGEKFYLAEFILSNQPPKAAAPAGGAEEEVEIELEVIADAPEVVVEGAKLINSAGDYATFNSKVTEFDGKSVVAISAKNVPGAVAIDGSNIFGKSEQTPNGALSLKTHRYAVISYYYASETDADRLPEFELLGGRIQNQGSVVNGVIAKSTEGLKKNEWATVIVKLSGNGEGDLTSGFNLKPFGNVAASAIGSSDVLYIENITFVSNRP